MKTLLTNVILKMANIIHESSRNARAGGFKITSLPQLMRTKNPKGHTFGRVLAEGLVTVAPELLQLRQELPTTSATRPDEISLITTNEIAVVVRDLSEQTKTAIRHFEKEGVAEYITTTANSFLRRSNHALRGVQSKLLKARETYVSTCKYFLENPAEIDADTLLKEVHNFLSLFDGEVEEAKKRLDRQNKAERPPQPGGKRPPPPKGPKPKPRESPNQPKPERRVAFAETTPSVSLDHEKRKVYSRTKSFVHPSTLKEQSLTRADSLSQIPSDVRKRGKIISSHHAKHIDRPRDEVMQGLMSFYKRSIKTSFVNMEKDSAESEDEAA